MPIEIIVPRLGWSMEEGAFVAWLKQDGELVRAGEPLFSIEGDKAVQEIESLDTGVLRIAAKAPKPGDPIRVGDVLGHLVSAGEMPAQSASPQARQAMVDSVAATSLPAAGSFGVTPPIQGSAAPACGRTISPRALRVAAELGVDWTKVTGSGRSGRIRERDILAAAGITKNG